MKFKRLFGAALLGTGLVAGLASCGGIDDAHTITFYHTMGDNLRSVLTEATSKFHEDHPEWQVSDTQVGNYDAVKEACIADLQAGTQPSLAYCYADHVAEYLTTGKVLDMNQFINDPEIGFSSEKVADFIPGYYDEGRQFGDTSKMYTLPFSKSTEVVYYNNTVCKELGIVVKDDWTWDDFWAACAKVKASKYSKWFPMGYDSEANWFITYCEQAGLGYTSATAPHYLFNNDGTKAWLASLKENYGKGYFTTQTINGSYTSNLFTKQRIKEREKEDGTKEKYDDSVNIVSCVFSIGSTGGASHQTSEEFEVGIAPIPRVAGKDLKVISQGPNLCMFNQENDEKAKMTWEFVSKYLMEPVFQAKFSMVSGYMPVLKSALQLSDYKAWLADEDNIIAQTSAVAASLVDSYYTSPAFRGSSTARTQVGNALIAAITGTKSIDDALKDAYDECNF